MRECQPKVDSIMLHCCRSGTLLDLCLLLQCFDECVIVLNNNVENDFWDFPTKSGYTSPTGEVNKSVRGHVKFSHDLTYQKLLKSANFWQSYSRNKKVDVFETGCRHRPTSWWNVSIYLGLHYWLCICILCFFTWLRLRGTMPFV